MHCILEVVAHVGDAVGPRHHLAFEGGGGGPAPRVVADAVEGLGAQVQGRESDVGAPDGMIEALVEEGRQGFLAGVAPRPVAAVVAEGDGFGQGHVEPAGAGDAGGDLGDLERVGEASAEVVGREDEHLCLAGQAPERGGMKDPIAIALETSAKGIGRFGDRPVTGAAGAGREGRERAPFDLLTLRADHQRCDLRFFVGFISIQDQWPHGGHRMDPV